MIISMKASKHAPLGLAFACFVVQGIANGLLGVAWPSIRYSFGLPLDSLVVLLISSTIGYVSGSVYAGKLMARIGIGRSLLIGNILAAIGLIGYACATSWQVFIVFGLLTGWTSGTVVASLNIFIASTRTVRVMNWMHAMYGIGATVGPLVMTAVIATRFGWRLGYIVAALFHLVLGILFLTVLNRMDFRGVVDSTTTVSRNEKPRSGILVALRVPIVLLSIFMFLFYTGIETTTGQWAFSLFTEGRSISPYLAGIMISAFWGMLTIGRIVFGAAANRIGITRLLRWSMVGTVISSAMFIIPSPIASFISVAGMGLSLAAIFPTLMSDTPNRVGPELTSSAIGLQTGAASLGLAILPGLAGIFAERLGLEVLGPYLIVASTLMLLTNEASIRMIRRNRLRVNLSSVV